MEYPQPFLSEGRMRTFLTKEEKAHFEVHVYILACAGFVKIGIATDVQKRIAGLQIGNPQKIELVYTLAPCPRSEALRIEQRAHRKLKAFNASGEWFQCAPATAIAAILGKFST